MTVTVADASEIGEGERSYFNIDGREIAVLNLEGEYYGVRNYCPHMEGPVGRGGTSCSETDDGQKRLTIKCPWHGWEFDLEDGSPIFPAKQEIPTYDAWEEDGKIVVDI